MKRLKSRTALAQAHTSCADFVVLSGLCVPKCTEAAAGLVQTAPKGTAAAGIRVTHGLLCDSTLGSSMLIVLSFTFYYRWLS